MSKVLGQVAFKATSLANGVEVEFKSGSTVYHLVITQTTIGHIITDLIGSENRTAVIPVTHNPAHTENITYYLLKAGWSVGDVDNMAEYIEAAIKREHYTVMTIKNTNGEQYDNMVSFHDSRETAESMVTSLGNIGIEVVVQERGTVWK